jgi:hypothetical protein
MGTGTPGQDRKEDRSGFRSIEESRSEGIVLTDGEGSQFFDPYPRFLNKQIQVRDRTGAEYEGILLSWGAFYITLQDGPGLILVSRQQGNIVSLRGQPVKGDR